MSGKSRRRKGKHLPQGKRRKSGRQFLATAAQQPAVAQTHEAVPQPGVSPPLASVPTPVAKLAAVRYPHLAAELRTIGILSGIILIILVILALVLS